MTTTLEKASVAAVFRGYSNTLTTNLGTRYACTFEYKCIDRGIDKNTPYLSWINKLNPLYVRY